MAFLIKNDALFLIKRQFLHNKKRFLTPFIILQVEL